MSQVVRYLYALSEERTLSGEGGKGDRAGNEQLCANENLVLFAHLRTRYEYVLRDGTPDDAIQNTLQES